VGLFRAVGDYGRDRTCHAGHFQEAEMAVGRNLRQH
jgi:hypothetical protein